MIKIAKRAILEELYNQHSILIDVKSKVGMRVNGTLLMHPVLTPSGKLDHIWLTGQDARMFDRVKRGRWVRWTGRIYEYKKNTAYNTVIDYTIGRPSKIVVLDW